MESIYEPAFNAIIDLLRGYGIYHQAMNARMLWDEMAHNATIFDLGDDENRTPEDAENPDVVYMIHSHHPIPLTFSFAAESGRFGRLHGMAERWCDLPRLVCKWSSTVKSSWTHSLLITMLDLYLKPNHSSPFTTHCNEG